jgi:hypothetical protein
MGLAGIASSGYVTRVAHNQTHAADARGVAIGCQWAASEEWIERVEPQHRARVIALYQKRHAAVVA